jgi:hypothetical protein
VEKSEAEGGRLARVALDERGLQSLADQGDASAQHILGAISNGISVAEDDHETVAWWRKSAEQGYAEAQCALGEAYRDGEGVDQNLNEAAGCATRRRRRRRWRKRKRQRKRRRQWGRQKRRRMRTAPVLVRSLRLAARRLLTLAA